MTWKLLFLIFVVFLPAASVSFSVVKPVLAAGYTDVSVSEARAMIETNQFLVLLDVRNQSEYDAGHIRNAKLIPVWQLTERLSELNETDLILVYCKKGGRSANASQILADNGFLHIYNMLLGIDKWTQEGLPVYVKYSSLQQAVDNATAGDTICVSAGLYAEQVSVEKSVSLEGENASTTVIDFFATVLNVSADNVSISDFTIQYSGCACFSYSSVNVTDCQNTNVTNNVIVSDQFGIQAHNVSGAIIAHNKVTHTGDSAISVLASSRVSVLENTVTASNGIYLDNSSESVIQDNIISCSRGAGIMTYQSHENTFSGNAVSVNMSNVISLSESDNNTFFGNNIASYSPSGLFFWQSNNNSIFHNNFLGNSCQLLSYRNSTDFWDDGLEGNYWSSYTGVDVDLDGIGDTPYVLDLMNRDNYPLTGMFHGFRAPPNHDVGIVSDSAISEFEYLGPNRTIRLKVSNATANQTVGFCRVIIPHNLIDPYQGSISVVIDDGLTPVLFLNNTLHDNGTHRWIYFTYPLSTHEILIVPEFPVLPILLVLMAMTIIVAGTWRRRPSSRLLAANKKSRASVSHRPSSL
jgi:parallel beta-helix repeat protein